MMWETEKPFNCLFILKVDLQGWPAHPSFSPATLFSFSQGMSIQSQAKPDISPVGSGSTLGSPHSWAFPVHPQSEAP